MTIKMLGYARVSTLDQNIDLQLDALLKAGCDEIIEESISGNIKASKRPKLQTGLAYLRKGDTFVVWKLDRLGRSLLDLITTIKDLEARGIHFKSLSDQIDTSTPIGRLFFHISGAFAEMERDLIKERTMAGLASARARGKIGGRPKAIDSKTFMIAISMHESGLTMTETCKRLSINRRTYYRHLKNHREQLAIKTDEIQNNNVAEEPSPPPISNPVDDAKKPLLVFDEKYQILREWCDGKSEITSIMDLLDCCKSPDRLSALDDYQLQIRESDQLKALQHFAHYYKISENEEA